MESRHIIIARQALVGLNDNSLSIRVKHYAHCSNTQLTSKIERKKDWFSYDLSPEKFFLVEDGGPRIARLFTTTSWHYEYKVIGSNETLKLEKGGSKPAAQRSVGG